MANSTMKIDLIFQANTQSALNNIQQLNNLLNQISTNTTIGVNSGSLDKAVQSAQQLSTHLAQAVNVDTGKLDLNKLNASLKQSGTNLQTLVTNLQAAGTQGQQAFVKLANSIASAQTPMLQVNQKLKEFGTTLLNTVKWQIASNMIHGVQSAIEGAISYAKDLNTALNDIRIVTGKSIDDMSKFTQTASKAAKELSSTTTEYAKAALIFYQQGLDGKAVEDRAEVVLKLAQVTGESAESISDQMTAVWNNFYDGSKSLEYYADVLTKLGAATASSTDEITQGLEKFAAVADTVGLSYEYAAASLATVVAETRQAPEVVGTAFKTLFARLQGLSLGETLEDGTDLNKYSAALATVGVQIKDQYGELKDADTILDETAEKWRLLSEDQQVALAQTVGGMRQYSQFIALMENWEDVEVNVELAEMSEGELTKQQEIWSESWQAATKRVEQSKNELYESLVNDEAMIQLQDTWASIISGFNSFIEQMGGLMPFLLSFVGIFSKTLFPLLLNGFTRLKNNISVLTGQASREVAKMQNDIRMEIQKMVESGDLSKATAQQLLMSDKLIAAKQELARATKNMSVAEKEAAERKMAIIEATSAEVQKSLELQSQLEREIDLQKEKFEGSQGLRLGAAIEATKDATTENKSGKSVTIKSDQEYEEIFGISRELIAEEATKTKSYSTKRELRLLDSHKKKEMNKAKETRADLLRKEKTGTITEQEKSQLAELKDIDEYEKKINEKYDLRKKQLNEILRIQEKISGEITEQSVGTTQGKGGFVTAKSSIDQENSTIHSYTKNMQADVANQLNGQVLDIKDEKGQFTGDQEVVAEASISNLEKAYKLSGKYKVAIEKTKAVEKDWIDIKNKNTAADKKLSDMLKGKTKLEQKAIKQSKKYKQAEQERIQTLQNTKASIMNLAKTANLGDKEIGELEVAFKQLDQGGDQAQAGMKTIDDVLKNLQGGFREAKGGVDLIIDSFEEMLRGKIPDDELDALKQRLKDLGLLSEQNAAKIDNLGNKLDDVGGSSSSWTSKLQNGITTLGNIAGTAMSAISAIQSFGTAFDSNAEPMERFSSYLMGVMGMIPVLNTLMEAATKAREARAKRNAKAAQTEQIAESGPAAAKTFKGVLDNIGGIPGVIAGVLAAAAVAAMIIGGVFTAISIGSSGQQSESEKKEEALGESVNQLTAELDKAKEAAEGFKEATSDYTESENAINKLTKGTQEYSDAIQEANEKARELIDQYGLLSDQYYVDDRGVIVIKQEALEEKQEELDSQVRWTSIAKYQTQAQLSTVSAENDLKENNTEFNVKERDNWTDEQKSEWVNNNAGVYTFSFDREDQETLANLTDYLGKDDVTGQKLTGEELRDTILNYMDASNMRLTDSDLYEKFKAVSADSVDVLWTWTDSLTAAEEANKKYAAEILKLIAENYFEEFATEMATNDDGIVDEGEKTVILNAMTAIADSSVNQEEITQGVSNSFDSWGLDAGNGRFNYENVHTSGNKEDSELLDVNEAMEDILGEGQGLTNWDVFSQIYGDGAEAQRIYEQIKDGSREGDSLTIKDLLKMQYEQQGWTSLDIEEEDGKYTVTGLNAKGESESSEGYTTEQVYTSFINKAKGYTTDTAISNEINAVNSIAQSIITHLESATNSYGADFSGVIESAFSNQEGNFDLTNVYSELGAGEVKEIQNMTPEEILAMVGLTKEDLVKGPWQDANDFADKFKAALEGYGSEEVNNMINESFSGKAEALELDTETFDTYRKMLKKTNPELQENATLLNEVAIANMRLDRGVEELGGSWDDFYSAMTSGDLTFQAEALNEMKDPIKDILNMSDEDFELLPDNFVQENLDLLQDVVNGVPGAVQEMQRIADSTKVLVELDTKYDTFSLTDDIELLNSQIAGYDLSDFTVGANIDDTTFVAMCEQMIAQSEGTATEIQNYFSKLGYNVVLQDDGNGKLSIKTISKDANYYGWYTNTSASQKALDAGNGGGDNSPAEKVEKTKRSDVVNRYEEIEDKLDDVRDAADKAAGAMDRLYGGDRIKAMKDQGKALKAEVDLLKDKRKQAEQYLKEDTDILAETATKAGVRLEFDENGNVTNYTEQMDRLWKQLNDAENKKAAMGTKEEQDDFDETHIQPIQDAIDTLSDAYDQYKDTREAIEDLDTEIQEAIYAWQDNNAEILNYEIELKADLNDRELQKLDYYLGKMEDDFYSMAESAALVGEKIRVTERTLNDSQINVDKFKDMYEAGEISQSAYVEGLKNEQDTLYSNLEALQELDDTMMNYYNDTLNKAQEELSEYTDRMEHQTSVLDHYRSLLDLTGQSQNFKAIGTVLEGQAKTIENSYQVAKENYEWLADEAIKKKQAMNDALARGDAEAAELYENEWKAAEEKMREAQDNMLSMAEEWASKLKEVLENKLAGIADALENALTGGRSFDELSMQMEHAQGIQEEYLTTTNKIYETNKMIRNAQNEIDKTTNTVAKQKLKAFQQETQQLQNQGQLSQFELDIQQKKYDLLLAEIALEEAQNAKSTVRLQRDSEGNFGYVYTADQAQVAGAEQGVEDAENALYNTRLEGANNYASQRQELLQGLYDSLTNLDNQYYLEGTISEEEYNRQKEAIQSYYFKRLGQNSELYAIATGDDAKVSQEAWSTSLGIMDEDAGDLVEAVDEYLSVSQTAFNEYQIGINKVAKDTGVDLDNLASNVKDITDESDKLKDEVVNEVLPALQDEVDKVSEVTGKYALHRGELALVMESYENLLTDIGNVITEMGKLAGKCDSVKTKAEQAASAVGSIGDIGTYAGTGDDNDNNNFYEEPEEEPKKEKSTIYLTRANSEQYQDSNGELYWKMSNGGYMKITALKDSGKTTSKGHKQYIPNSFASVYAEMVKTGTLNSRGIPAYKPNGYLWSYDTGGYTGEWGPEGKWALLHQKELVLNASQTEDLLMTMELLDSIIKQIDMMTMNNKINQMNAAVNEAVNAMYREQMTQEIHIEANFPNATDRNEIYQALEMLANDASQFVNR